MTLYVLFESAAYEVIVEELSPKMEEYQKSTGEYFQK